MPVLTITPRLSDASDKIINAINDLRRAKEQIETVNAIIQNMTDAQVLEQTGFSGTGTQLRGTFQGLEDALNDQSVINATEMLNWIY